MKTSNTKFDINLTSVGFSANESQIYLALLELGKGTVSQITRKAGINRTTGYEVLNNLVAKGLVTISGKKPRQEYAAESPDRLQKFFDDQLLKNQQYKATVANLVPQLKSLHNVSDRPQVRFYEGKEGLVQVYEDTLTSHEPIRAYASVEDTQHTLPDYFPQYYKRRAAKGIKIRAIFPKTSEALELVKHDAEEIRETILVPADQFNFSPEINIYNNKVMIASWREKLGIIIESREIADAMKKIYEIAWVGAEEINKKINH